MKIVGKNNNTKTEASYPLYDLAEAVKVAEAVRNLGGCNTLVAKRLLAQHLNYAETGPSFFQRVAAAKTFGLIEGRGAYSLTNLAKQYFYPTVENGKEAAAVKSLTFPKAFDVLVQKFDGFKLPAIDKLGDIIHTEAEIPESKKNTVAGIFLRSIQFIGAVDVGGFLRCRNLVSLGKKVMDGIDNGTIPKEFNLDNAPDDLKPKDEEKDDSGYHIYILPLPKDRKITVKAPLDLTKSEIERLKKWAEFTLFLDWKEDERKGESQ